MKLVYKTVKNHTGKVQTSVLKLKTEEKLCDVTIKCGNFEVKAHKVVLASSTEYFREMFLNNNEEAWTSIVDFSAMIPEVVKQCIDFIYSGTVGISMDIVRELLDASEMMQLTELSNLCVEFLTENIDIQSCPKVLGLIRLYDKESLKLSMKKFITANFEKFRKTADFLSLDYGCLVHCITFIEQGHSRLEMQKWYGIWHWTNQSCERQKHFTDLFKMLDLRCLPRKFLSEHICCLELVKASAECLQLIQDTLLVELASFERQYNITHRGINETQPTVHHFGIGAIVRKCLLVVTRTIQYIFGCYFVLAVIVVVFSAHSKQQF